MADPTFLLKKQGKYLWYGLQQLGIEKDSNLRGTRKHIELGPDMFSKPNREAFHVVILFLLKKLNLARATEEYRYCWPVVNPKDDAEFRKHTCAWVKEIVGNKALPSLFLSPGGPKFVSLMLDLVKHVMLQEIKNVETDGSWVPEAGLLPVSSLHMARNRIKVVRSRFLRVRQDQALFIDEYKEHVQDLVESKKKHLAEVAKYEELINCSGSKSTPEGSSLAEEVQKGRTTFGAVDEMLAPVGAWREPMDCALRIMATDEHVLDGAKMDLKIPQHLREWVEKLPHQLSSGNLYKDGKLDLLCLLELGCCAAEMRKERRQRLPTAAGPLCQLQELQENHDKIASAKQKLQLCRAGIEEKIPGVRDGVMESEASWDKKWGDHLRNTSLDSFLDEDPLTVSHLSFDSDSAANSESILSLYRATLLDGKPPESEGGEEIVQTVPVDPIKRAASPAVRAPRAADTSLDWFCDSPPASSPPTPPQPSVMETNRPLLKVAPLRTKAQIMDHECDTLADQLAEAVTSARPADGSKTGADFEHLLNVLHHDPFSARKQIPRTPESLLEDVRSSWRKVLEEDNVKANQGDQSLKFNSSITTTSLLSPLCKTPMPSGDAQTPKGSAALAPIVAPQISQLKSSLAWDSMVRFSLEDETLPEMPGCDSLLSLDGHDDSDIKSEDEVFVRRPLNTEAAPSPQTTHDHLLVKLEQAPSPQRLLSEPVKSTEEKVFSLDFDKLETPKRTEFSLPQLITFSPIEDM